MVKPGVLTKPEPLSLRLTRDLAGNLERVVINDGDEFDALCQAQKDGRLPVSYTHLKRGLYRVSRR